MPTKHWPRLVLLLLALATYASCNEVVVPVDAASIEVTPAQETLRVGDVRQFRARVEDDTVAYVEPTGDARTETQIRLPWKSSDDVRKLRIEAVDDDGLKDFFSGSL